METEVREVAYKVLVVGDVGVGKTSLIRRLTRNEFSMQYRSTIGVDFEVIKIKFDDETLCRVDLWDISGQERFAAMTRVFYTEARGALVVFDSTQSKTYDNAFRWKTDIDEKVLLRQDQVYLGTATQMSTASSTGSADEEGNDESEDDDAAKEASSSSSSGSNSSKGGSTANDAVHPNEALQKYKDEESVPIPCLLLANKCDLNPANDIRWTDIESDMMRSSVADESEEDRPMTPFREWMRVSAKDSVDVRRALKTLLRYMVAMDRRLHDDGTEFISDTVSTVKKPNDVVDFSQNDDEPDEEDNGCSC